MKPRRHERRLTDGSGVHLGAHPAPHDGLHDESNIYDRVFPHRTARHSTGQYVDGSAHTQGIESFWSVLKHAHKGTFHLLSAKHPHRYVNEFAGRHNIRPLDTDKQMARVADGMIGKRLTYRELVQEATDVYDRC